MLNNGCCTYFQSHKNSILVNSSKTHSTPLIEEKNFIKYYSMFKGLAKSYFLLAR
jgi:hypothetical protein